jgi:hypothetical protein
MSNAQKPNFEEISCYICELCVDIKHVIVAKLIGVISCFKYKHIWKKNYLQWPNCFLQVPDFVIVMANFFSFDNLVPKT